MMDEQAQTGLYLAEGGHLVAVGPDGRHVIIQGGAARLRQVAAMCHRAATFIEKGKPIPDALQIEVEYE